MVKLAWMVLGLSVSLGGCTGAEIAVVGAASEGLRTGQEVTRSGRVRLALMDTGPRVRDAARAVCDELGLKVRGVEQRGEHAWVILAADYRNTLRIAVHERAPRVTQVEVNVGILGPQSVAELILKRVVARLELDARSDEDRGAN